MSETTWYCYLVRCRDGSLYTGITTDLNRRIDAHNEGKGAKYTRNRQPVQLVYQEHSISRSDASKREHALKSLKKAQKERLIDIYQIKESNEGLK